MNTMFYVLCIVAIVLAANTIQQYLKLRHRRENKSALADETQAQLDALEERIRVLERIVTENKFDLRDEINRL
jgi:cell division protein FtsB